ncbi:uncharacterized protein LOC141590593 [Silene latifolia]|uniref:uncharacterized protein LOC141590593 n=1 Tax=Silene latifolia TaxID=37657 RepID=UPI003D77CF18
MVAAINTRSSSSSTQNTQKNLQKNGNKFDLLSRSSLEEFPALTRSKQGPSTTDIRKEKGIHEVVGVPALNLETLVEDEPLSDDNIPAVPVPEAPVMEAPLAGLLQFTAEEVKVEMDYWKNSVYCFILGANPPWEIVEGFIRRLWVNHQGHFLFDNKPLIVKPWTPEVELVKHEVKSVPEWVRLHKLPLKFWGKGIGKISGLIGEFIKCDLATEDKTRLGFARVMIEIQIGSPLPDKVKFLDEQGNLIIIDVEFEWKSLVCAACKGLGHGTADCRKAKKQAPVAPAKGKTWAKIWRPKQAAKPVVTGEASSSTVFVEPVTKQRVEIQLKTPVIWSKAGTYSSGPTPIRPIIRLSRQDLADGGYIVHRFGQHTFLDSLNGSTTPKVGIGFAGNINGPWVVCGDFNSVLSHSERLGGDSLDAEIDDFQQCLDRCALVDGPAIGSYFTWNNKQDHATRVYSRLDRVLINAEWSVEMNDMYANFLPEGTFDHTPCLIQSARHQRTHRKPFKYYTMWGKSPHFIPHLVNWWKDSTGGTKMFKLVSKLKHLKFHLRKFNKDHFDDIENCTIRALKNLEYIQTRIADDPRDVYWLVKEKQAHEEVKELQQACALFLSQKAKIAWTKDGDCNTKYFHGIIKTRFMRNQIITIKDRHGRTHSDPKGVQESFLDFYKYVLGTEVSTDPVNHQIIKRGRVCSESHWEQLLSPVTPQEIKTAIFSIPDHKAPGPDGYTSSFFKDSWSVIGDEVCAAIMDVFASGKLFKQINATTLTLIPKCKMPTSVIQFRPIACCNVLYKCISKLMCNRLAKVLPELISLNQGGFIKGRSIIENIMICQDLVKLYNRQAFSSRCMFKMDLMKAYDSVSFTAFHFPEQFKNLVMECVTSAAFSLAINGETFGFFHGKRGLIQGDPISPLIFTLCMEYLSRILACATEKMQFNYHPLCKQMKLTHLMFADDLLMFCRGNAHSMVLLLRAFSAFSNASGLKMNPQKSCAYFSGVQSGLKHDILSISGFLEGTLPFKYLGVPITAGRLKIKDCASLIDKIVNRVRSLGAKKLSFAGRLTLVSSVLSTMHTYWASMFVLPQGVIKRVDAICRNFLWEGGADYNKAPLLAWQKVCSPKKEGGLGLKWSLTWNIATVGKLAWYVATRPDKLWVQWVHHVYMKASPWLEYTPSTAVSWHWKKVCQVRDIIKQDYLTDGIEDIYTVKGCYNWLRDRNDEVTWYKSVWCTLAAPKHAFIAWLVSQQALRMKDRLYVYNVVADNLCCLCAMAIESHTHVFQDCPYTLQVMNLVTTSLGASFSSGNVLQQIKRRRWSSLRKNVTTAAIIAVWYYVWMQRNEAWIHHRLSCPSMVARQIATSLLNRFHTCCNKPILPKDSLWLSKGVDNGDRVIIRFLAIIWSIWCNKNNLVFRDCKFSLDAFFNLQSRTAAYAINATESSRRRPRLDYCGVHLPFNEVREKLKECILIYLIGTGHGCNTIRVKVEASWMNSLRSAAGWWRMTRMTLLFKKVVKGSGLNQRYRRKQKKTCGFFHLEEEMHLEIEDEIKIYEAKLQKLKKKNEKLKLEVMKLKIEVDKHSNWEKIVMFRLIASWIIFAFSWMFR